MSWRARLGLPRLHMGWTWLRHDVVGDQVLLHHPHGLWAWVPLPDAARMGREHERLLDQGLRQAVRAQLRGLCVLYLQLWDRPARIWLVAVGASLERVRNRVDLQRLLVETCASCEGTGWTALGQCPDCRHARNDLAYLQRTAP